MIMFCKLVEGKLLWIDFWFFPYVVNGTAFWWDQGENKIHVMFLLESLAIGIMRKQGSNEMKSHVQ